MSALETAVDIAGVISGVAAAAALVYTWREAAKDVTDVAGKVVAWAVDAIIEGDPIPDQVQGGVLLVNGTNEMALDVAVKTQKEITGPSVKVSDGPARFEDDGYRGQHIALVPPGALYLPHISGENGRPEWATPLAVNQADGRYRVTFKDDHGQVEERTLVPITGRPERRRVVMLRFTVANKVWSRDASGQLQKAAGQRLWDGEFDESTSQPPTQPLGAQHQPNEASQHLISQLFARLSAPGSDTTPNTVAVAAPDVASWGIARVRRTRGIGQGVFLMTDLDNEWPRFYVSAGRRGDNLESFPNDGLQFHQADGAKVERIAVSEFRGANGQIASRWHDDIDGLVAILGREIRSRLAES